MKKKYLLILGLLAVLVLVAGCGTSTGEAISDAELEKQLSRLSPEELDEVIEEAESSDTGAVAGQAFTRPTISGVQVKGVSKERVARFAYKVKSTSKTTLKLVPRCVGAINASLGKEGWLLSKTSPDDPFVPYPAVMASFVSPDINSPFEVYQKLSEQTDYCDSDEMLVEFYCDNSDLTKIHTKLYGCTNLPSSGTCKTNSWGGGFCNPK